LQIENRRSNGVSYAEELPYSCHEGLFCLFLKCSVHFYGTLNIHFQHLLEPCSFGEENGWRCAESYADYVWVLDPIDGMKSFITGSGSLIAL